MHCTLVKLTQSKGATEDLQLLLAHENSPYIPFTVSRVVWTNLDTWGYLFFQCCKPISRSSAASSSRMRTRFEGVAARAESSRTSFRPAILRCSPLSCVPSPCPMHDALTPLHTVLTRNVTCKHCRIGTPQVQLAPLSVVYNRLQACRWKACT